MRTNIIPRVLGSTNTEGLPTNPWPRARGDGVGHANDSSTGVMYYTPRQVRLASPMRLLQSCRLLAMVNAAGVGNR